MSSLQTAINARTSSNLLQLASAQSRSQVLKRIKIVLEKHKEQIFEANLEDIAYAQKEVEAGRLSQSLFKRLDIKGENEAKFETMLKGIDEIDMLEDPIGRISMHRELDEGLVLKRVSCPVGVLLVIFEARPEVVVNIACLSIKSANAAILKGGKEASKTNRVLADLIKQAILSVLDENSSSNNDCPEFPINAIQLVDTRDEIHELLQLEKYIDLAIPRGSNALVKYVQNNTRIPVLGHADGLCSIYIDQNCDINKAAKIVVDAKTDYPAACNSVETLLVHADSLSECFPAVAKALIDSKVVLHLDSKSKSALLDSGIDFNTNASYIVDAVPEDYNTEFLSLELAVKVVSNIEEAITHINTHGSKHTDCIITSVESNGEYFMNKVDAAGVYMNASTRFADGFRYGFGAEVGVSTNKTHARGPVGLEGLTIYKYKLYGIGQAASEYGPGKKQYTHRDF
ncbi:hypothetical protein BB561_000731 [Smittium simulii]|uniref:glutamate-5-semialdehyde dehydrogenase n=1 Tax=Smittium simulii TaxID=133385 RepID=A0A2T9YXT4_9FUNG|nr:hypothetical protein BB561_000731 [Smittium simulii]